MNKSNVILLVKVIILLNGYSLLAQHHANSIAEEVFSRTNEFAEEPERHLVKQQAPEAPWVVPIRDRVGEPVFFTLKKAEVKKVLNERPEELKFRLQISGGQDIVLELYQAEYVTPDFTLRKASAPERTIPFDPGLHYRGIVNGEVESIAMLLLRDNEIGGIIEYRGQQYNMGLVQGQTDIHVLYPAKEMKDPPVRTCHVQPSERERPATGGTGSSRSPNPDNCVTVYVEVDYDIFLQFSGVTAAANYVAGLFSQVIALYDDEQVNLKLNEVFVWDEEDPYVGGPDGARDYVEQFRGYRNGDFNGANLGHLVGAEGGGGWAYINVICNGLYGVGYSDIPLFYNQVPAYSWAVNLVTHEIGHNLGSRHTHDCAWNGNDTPIDNCGPQAGYPSPDDPCPDNGVTPSVGTIMSYCHLISGVGVSFTENFGQQPGDLIRDRVYNSTCLSTCSTTTILGCTDPTSHNYNPNANQDDGSCETCSDGIQNGDETSVDCGGVLCWPCQVSNDDCEQAIPLSVYALGNCSYSFFTTINATNSGVSPGCGNTSWTDDDVWFVINSGTSGWPGGVNVTVDFNNNNGSGIAIYTGNCGTLIPVACDQMVSIPDLEYSGPVPPNTNLYIQVWTYGNGPQFMSAFNICVEALSGCTDPAAHNYHPDANSDDGSCETCSDGIQNGDETGVDCGGALCEPCTVLPPVITEFTDGAILDNGCSNAGRPNEGIYIPLSWTTVAGADLYNVYLSNVGASFPLLNLNTVNTSANYSCNNCLTYSSSVYVQVRARVDGVWSPFPSPVFATYEPVNTDCPEGCTNPYAPNYDPVATVDDGSCETCIDGLTINGEPILPETYTSSSTITSSGTVPSGTSVTFQAAQSITLQPGFHAQVGSDFLAMIGDCTPAPLAQEDNPEGIENEGQKNSQLPERRVVNLNIFPNPFRNETTIRYELPEDRPTQLVLIDMLGRAKVLQLSAMQSAGIHEYRLRGADLRSGIYFLQLRTGEESISRKIQVVH